MRKEVDNIITQFIQAYSILEEEVYIPEKHRQGFVTFTKRMGKMESEPPTKLKQLYRKIKIDEKIRDFIVGSNIIEEIYNIVKLGKNIQRT